MGGQISIIKKYNGKVTCVSGWTNSFSNVSENIEFLEDPENKRVKEYLRSSDKADGIIVDQYGLYCVDYDTKIIYSQNGYSDYISTSPASISLDEKFGNPNRPSPFRKFYDKEFVCIREIYKDDTNESGNRIEFHNINSYGVSFKSFNHFIEWYGDRMNPSTGGYDEIKKQKGVIISDIMVDFQKMGWQFKKYNQDNFEYIQIYKDMVSNSISPSDINLEQWNEYLGDLNQDGDLDHVYGDREVFLLESLRNEILDDLLE